MPDIYCGTRIPLPLQYQRLGTPYECLRKGVGVGKYLLQPHPPHLQPQPNANGNGYPFPFFTISVYILLIGLLLLYLHRH